MNSTNATESVFATSRSLPFTPAAIFAAFADPACLSSWWGPAGFRNTFETCEFRSGGAWKFVMHGPDGKDYPNEAQFVEVNAPSRIFIAHVSPPHFTLTITLEEKGKETVLTWRQAFEDAEVAARVKHIVLPANEQNLDRLQAALAGVTA